MRRIAFLALAVAALPFVGCGITSDELVDIVLRPSESALPLPGTGESVVFGAKNLSTEPALVTATLYSPAGGAGTPLAVPVIPGRGEVQVAVAGPPADGWIHVETRDALTLAPLPTTGFVIPYVQKQGAGPRGEYAFGLPFASTQAAMPFGPDTTTVQVINRSRSAAVPTTLVPLAVNVTIFDTSGAVLSTTPVVIPDSGVFLVPGIPAGAAGQVLVAIAAEDPLKLEAFTIATREDPAGLGLSLGFGLDRQIDAQSPDTSRFTELAFEFGRTNADDYRDFAILATNATDETLSIQFSEIRDAGGGAILTLPRLFTLGPRETRYFATSLANTIGLETGEVHPFADLFGDVFLQAGVRVLRFSLIHADGIVVTAPNFDPAFFQAYQEVVESDFTANAIAVGVEQEITTSGAERNWFTFTNPAPATARIFVRVFTPGGSEYLLPDLFVPANGRLDWSPDAIVLNGLLGIREDQTVATDPPVPFLSFQFSSSTGLGMFGRREVRGPDDVLILVTPHVVEPLD